MKDEFHAFKWLLKAAAADVLLAIKAVALKCSSANVTFVVVNWIMNY